MNFIFVNRLVIGEDVMIFLNKLCETLKDSSRNNYHLGEVVLKVNRLIKDENSTDIIPEVCQSLTQEVFFNFVGAPEEDVEGRIHLLSESK